MIEDLQIETFGHFQNYHLQLSPGFNVIYGPNEAGKSTLTAFVESLLFGFRNKNQKKLSTYQEGQSLIGGSLRLNAPTLGHIRIRRTKDKTASLTITDEQGEDLDEATLRTVLKGMERDHFLALHEFNQEQLRELTATTPEEWNQLFYTLSGSGSLTLYQIHQALEGRAEAIYTPQSKKRELDQLLAHYRSLVTKKEDLKEQQAGYLTALGRQRDLAKQLADLDQTYQQEQQAANKRVQLYNLQESYEQYKILAPLAAEELLQLTEDDRRFLAQFDQRLEQLKEQEGLYQEQAADLLTEAQSDQERYRIFSAWQANGQKGQRQLDRIRQDQPYLAHLTDEVQGLKSSLAAYRTAQHLPSDWQGECFFSDEAFGQIEGLKEELDHLTYQEQMAAANLVQVSQQEESAVGGAKPVMKWQLSGLLSLLVAMGVCWLPLGKGRLPIALVLLAVTLAWTLAWTLWKVQQTKAQVECQEAEALKEKLAREQVASIRQKKSAVATDLGYFLDQANWPIEKLEDLIASHQYEKGRQLASDLERTLTKQQQLTDQADRLFRQVQTDLQPLLEQWQAGRPDDLEALYQWLIVFQQEGHRLAQRVADQEKTLALYQKQLGQVREDKQKLLAHLKELMTVAGVTAYDQLQEALKSDHRRREARLKRQQLEELFGPYLDDLRQVKQPISAEDLAKDQEKLAQLTQTRQGLQADWMDVSASIKQMETDGRYEELLAACEQAKQDIREKMVEWAANQLGMGWIQYTLDQRLGQSMTSVFERAADYLSRLTEGRYTGLKTTGKRLEVLSSMGERVALKDLSLGTVEQLYTALRLAMTKGDDLPLLIDDAFVNFDPVRRELTYRLLAELGKEQQIILMTFDQLACPYADRLVEIGTSTSNPD